jgi:hypothetical protein
MFNRMQEFKAMANAGDTDILQDLFVQFPERVEGFESVFDQVVSTALSSIAAKTSERVDGLLSQKNLPVVLECSSLSRDP